MMEKIKVDCALFFALEEEYKIIESYKNIKKNDEFCYFNFIDKNGIERICVVSYVAKPSILNAYKYIKNFQQKIDSEYNFIIGLSGQLSDDIKLGDVVVANYIDWYDYDQKFKDGDNKLSGEVINLNWHEEVLKYLNSKKKSDINNWANQSKIYLSTLFSQEQITQLVNKSFIRKDYDIFYKYGRIASGNSVVDDPEVKNTIRNKDRKLLCVDMESYGFADALGTDSKMIILRAICDTADGRKKELDNFADNFDGIRKWSLDNAFGFFYNILLKTIDFSNENESCIYKTRPNEKIDSFIDKYPKDAFNYYSELFQEIILNVNKEEVDFYESFTKEILEISESPVVITGLPGSGKTTLLYSLYKYFSLKNIKCNYIDLHFLKKLSDVNVVNIFLEEIEIIKKDEVANILIIDGLDEYERFFINQDIVIDSHWHELSTRYKHIILGVTKQDFENEEDERRLYFVNEPQKMVSLTNFSFTDYNLAKIINNILKINSDSISRYKIIKAFFDNTNLKEVDWHTANLIVNKIGSFNYDNINSLGELFHRYARDFFSQKRVAEQQATHESSQLAFKKYIKEECLSIEDYKSEKWIFIQQSNTVKQFLIAEHLISQYINLFGKYEESIVDLNYVYSYKINSYFKDNLNRTKLIQKKVFESITLKYNELSLIQRPNACYILGRLEIQSLKDDAKKFLAIQLENEIAEYEAKKYNKDTSQFRQHLLLIRTIYISLVYQGEAWASERYLQHILFNSDWDDLNRGFHMEYYGDKKYDPTKLGLHNDDLKANFINTYTRLSKRIRNALSSLDQVNYLMFDIELQTITSLAVNRYISGKLDDKIKCDITNLLYDVLNKRIDLCKCDTFKAFITLSHYIISNEKNSISSILEDIFRIKKIKRSGWNFAGQKGSNYVQRIVNDSESVADHTYGTLLIAMFFLPDNVDGEIGYSKDVIIKMLLIHDLAESFTGDILTFKKGEDEFEVEDNQMKVILSLTIIEGFGDFSEYTRLWDDFKTKHSINAKIANDIDKIENFFQLQIYYKEKQNIISDYESWKLSLNKNIITKTGKDIMYKLGQ